MTTRSDESARSPADPTRANRYLAVEGPIGVGKTSLAELLAKEFGGRMVYEEVDANPFLEKFYREREKYAFQTQLFFLISRFQQQRELSQQDLFSQFIVSDYILAKDRIFAYLNLNEDEIVLYEKIFRILDAKIVKPDLAIYLQATPEVLLSRIEHRGKYIEKNITMQYLGAVNEAYNQFFFQYNESPLLVVNTSAIDFVKNRGDLDRLVREVRSMGAGVKHFVPMVSAGT